MSSYFEKKKTSQIHPSVPPLEIPTMSPPIAPPRIHNIGIIGYGLSAKVFHIPLILECSAQFKLHAIVQRCSTPENDAERDHPGIRIYMSAEEMLRDVEVDVVVVTTPPETHFALSKMALEGGRHGIYVCFVLL